MNIQFDGEEIIPGIPPRKRAWSFVYRDALPFAVYYAEWTDVANVEEMDLDVIIGEWGDGTSAHDRGLVSVWTKLDPVQFMVVDSNTRLPRYLQVASKAMSREEVLSSAIKAPLFELLDLIFQEDDRLPGRT
jgi:hypothetical protein